MDLSFEQFYAKHWDAVHTFCHGIHPDRSAGFWLSIQSFERLRPVWPDLASEDQAYSRLLIIGRQQCILYGTERRTVHRRRRPRIGRWILHYILLEGWARHLIFSKNYLL